MANITFDSPIAYESISQGRRREQALGGELASNMMNNYFKAQALRAQEQRWDQELPLRNAQLTLLSARAAGEKADAELGAIAAASAARRREDYASLAALQEDAAAKGWDSQSEQDYYRFLSTHPDFVNSPEGNAVAQRFTTARLLKERLDSDLAEVNARNAARAGSAEVIPLYDPNDPKKVIAWKVPGESAPHWLDKKGEGTAVEYEAVMGGEYGDQVVSRKPIRGWDKQTGALKWDRSSGTNAVSTTGTGGTNAPPRSVRSFDASGNPK